MCLNLTRDEAVLSPCLYSNPETSSYMNLTQDWNLNRGSAKPCLWLNSDTSCESLSVLHGHT